MTMARARERIALGGGRPQFIGSPTTVADEMERWVAHGDIDGFLLMPLAQPAGFTELERPAAARAAAARAARTARRRPGAHGARAVHRRRPPPPARLAPGAAGLTAHRGGPLQFEERHRARRRLAHRPAPSSTNERSSRAAVPGARAPVDVEVGARRGRSRRVRSAMVGTSRNSSPLHARPSVSTAWRGLHAVQVLETLWHITRS